MGPLDPIRRLYRSMRAGPAAAPDVPARQAAIAVAAVEAPAGPAPAAAPAGLTVPQLLDARAAAMPDHTPLAVLTEPGLSYADWLAKSSAAAAGLAAAGCGTGTRVALLYDGLDWLDYAIAYMAVLRCGATVLHMNAHMADAEILRRLAECECSWIVHSAFVAAPTGFAGRVSTVADLAVRATGDFVAPAIAADAIAEIRYTSGTTGAAKGYLVSHANLTYGRTLDTMQELARASRMLVPMTLGSSTSATILTIAATSAVQMVLCSPLDIERMGELIESEKISAFMLTPHIAGDVIESRLHERYDLSSVRLVASASSLLSPPVAEALLAMMPGATLQIACAQSEASPALLTHTFDPARPFCVGKPSPATEACIVGADHAELPRGQIGELWLRTPAPKRLFLAAPAVNAQLLEDGWYRTGDLARMNEDGSVEFFDRRVDALTRDGHLISSIHMESSFRRQPGVRDAAIVAVPGRDGAGRIVAFVVLRDPNGLPALRDSLREALPPQHYPDAFIAVSALPRTQNGKVLKRQLRLHSGIR